MFGGGGGVGGMDPAQQPTFPTVLHFLQSEWARFDRDRAKWQEEKATFKARIAFLEGQRVGEVNLKRDLLRRIKMLEHALRAERAARAGSDADAVSQPFEPQAAEPAAPQARSDVGGKKIKEGRQILFQYLSEMGYTDGVIHAQAQRLKASFQSWPPVVTVGNSSGGDAAAAGADGGGGGGGADAAFDFLEDEDGDDDDDDQGKAADNEFEVTELSVQAVDPEADGGIPEEMPIVPPAGYVPPPPAPDDDDDDDDVGSGGGSAEAEAEAPPEALEDNVLKAFGDAGAKMMRRQSRKKGRQRAAAQGLFGQDAGAGNVEPGLADLFDLDIGSDKKSSAADEAANAQTEALARKKWKANHELRGHYDGVQALAFHRKHLRMVSASEDMTVKVWDLESAVASRRDKSPMEPLTTLRGHASPVLSVALSSRDLVFSGDSSGLLNAWTVPQFGAERPPPYDPGAHITSNQDHTDAIWALDLHDNDTTLLSAGADGTCRLWNTGSNQLEPKSTIVSEYGAIGSGGFVASDPTRLVLGHASGEVSLHDVETSELVATMEGLEGSDGAEKPSNINCIATHHTLRLIATAGEDQHISFYDLDTGKMIHSMVAHQKAVSSISFDASGLYLVSGGHDRSIRIWDVGTRQCVNEITTHRHNWDEAINAVRFHPVLPHFASAGADSTIKLFS